MNDEEGRELIGGANALVAEDLSLQNPERGDARLFTYPNGDSGLFIERTGAFYKLEEIDLRPPEPSPQPTPLPTLELRGTRGGDGGCNIGDCVSNRNDCTWTCCLSLNC